MGKLMGLSALALLRNLFHCKSDMSSQPCSGLTDKARIKFPEFLVTMTASKEKENTTPNNMADTRRNEALNPDGIVVSFSGTQMLITTAHPMVNRLGNMTVLKDPCIILL